MIRRRIGNDIVITGTLSRDDGAPEDFTGARGMVLTLRHSRQNWERVLGFSLSGNSITFAFDAKDQMIPGPYHIMLTYEMPSDAMPDGWETITRDYFNVLELVPRQASIGEFEDTGTPVLAVSPSSLTFTGMETLEVMVDSNRGWTVTAPDWLNAVPPEGTGDGTVEVTPLSPKTGRADRTGTVRVSAEIITRTVPITQLGEAEFVTLLPPLTDVPKEGGEVTLSGSSNANALTFSLGSGTAVVEIPASYTANGEPTLNGADVDGDPGADGTYDFSITVDVGENEGYGPVARTLQVITEGGSVAVVGISQNEWITPPGSWTHYLTGEVTEFGMDAPFIEGTAVKPTIPWIGDASEINFPYGVSEVEGGVLNNGVNISEVVFPETVMVIGAQEVNKTKKWTVHAMLPPDLDALPISSEDVGFQIKVPAAVLLEYRDEPTWGDMRFRIFPYNAGIPGSRVHGGYTDTIRTPVYRTAETDIIIENIHFDFEEGGGAATLWLDRCENVVIRNCRFTGNRLRPALYMYVCKNVLIYNCDFLDVQCGIRAGECEDIIQVVNNDFLNLKGTMYGSPEFGQAIQYIECTGGNYVFQDNAVENILGESYPEDLVNPFACYFDEGSPLRIRGNWLRGGGPSDSGGGLMTGDYGGNNQIIEDNILVNPGQYGIAIAGGSNNTMRNNVVVGKSQPFVNIAVYAANWTPEVSGPSLNITVENNRVNWYDRDNQQTVWWTGGIDPSELHADNPVVWDDDLDETILPEKIIGV